MKDAYSSVLEFHLAFHHPAPATPCIPPVEVVKLRWDLMNEELSEYAVACASRDLVGIADALADLAYVVIGTAVAHGLSNFGDIFNEVHRSNMSKLDENGRPIYRSDGKVMKGKNFIAPDLRKLVEE